MKSPFKVITEIRRAGPGAWPNTEKIVVFPDGRATLHLRSGKVENYDSRHSDIARMVRQGHWVANPPLDAPKTIECTFSLTE